MDVPEEITEIEIKFTENNLGIPPTNDVHEISDLDASAEETSKKGLGRPKMLRTGMRGRPKRIFSTPRETMNVASDDSIYLIEVPFMKTTSKSRSR